jgi:hypothetical protein
MSQRLIAIGAMFALVLVAAGVFAAAQTPAPAPAGPLPFEGTWSAVGRRRALPTGGVRNAVIVELSGAVVLKGSTTGLSRGFQGEAIGFDDGRNISAGSAVWTDTRGNKVFSVFSGTTMQTGRRVAGEITGGTGLYAGASGDYAMTWQYVVEDESGTVQGRAADLKGTITVAGARQ